MLALDCEFNGHNGYLISMALSATNGDEFYEVTSGWDTLNVNQWVKENVIPVLNKQAISQADFKDRLWNFLRRHPQEIIVADSPADFIYLLQQCHMMTEDDKYKYINLDLKMYFVVSGPYQSAVPHNALEDARALKNGFTRVRPINQAPTKIR